MSPLNKKNYSLKDYDLSKIDCKIVYPQKKYTHLLCKQVYYSIMYINEVEKSLFNVIV